MSAGGNYTTVSSIIDLAHISVEQTAIVTWILTSALTVIARPPTATELLMILNLVPLNER